MFGALSTTWLIFLGLRSAIQHWWAKTLYDVLFGLSAMLDLITNFFHRYGWKCILPRQEHELLYKKTWFCGIRLCSPDRPCTVICGGLLTMAGSRDSPPMTPQNDHTSITSLLWPFNRAALIARYGDWRNSDSIFRCPCSQIPCKKWGSGSTSQGAGFTLRYFFSQIPCKKRCSRSKS